MSNKTSDENVGSIEEDIKIIKNSWLYNDEENVKFVNAIEHLLQDYTRQKQINEERQKENGLLREQVRMLDEAYTGVIKESKKWFDIAHNSIPKQKIKDKIEELKRQRRELGFKTYLKKEDIINDDRVIMCEISVLQELLQESEDK